INDIGLTAVTRTFQGQEEVGFSLRVGGGLSAEPYLASPLDAFVRWNQVLPTIQAIAELFRDSDQLREHRERARLKFLFLRHGWSAKDFQRELERRVGFHFDAAVEEHTPDDAYGDRVRLYPETQAREFSAGAAVL